MLIIKYRPTVDLACAFIEGTDKILYKDPLT